MLRNILFAAVTLLSGVAVAERPHPVTHNDGSVEVNGKVYASTYEWLTSPEFQDAGGRCGTEMAPLLSPVIAPSDCTMNVTHINQDYNDDRTFVIQVVFHLVSNTSGTGNVTDSQVASQIQVLNDDYQAAANSHGAPGEREHGS